MPDNIPDHIGLEWTATDRLTAWSISRNMGGGFFSFHILGIHGAARNATVIYVDLTPRGQPDVGGKIAHSMG